MKSVTSVAERRDPSSALLIPKTARTAGSCTDRRSRIMSCATSPDERNGQVEDTGKAGKEQCNEERRGAVDYGGGMR